MVTLPFRTIRRHQQGDQLTPLDEAMTMVPSPSSTMERSSGDAMVGVIGKLGFSIHIKSRTKIEDIFTVGQKVLKNI